ncbi:DNA polymerase IV [Humibacter ginsengiterrae]
MRAFITFASIACATLERVGRGDGRDRQVTVGPVDDSGATKLHVDMDAFYASVELLDRPELRGRPAIVGHASGRSVVSSATYEARLAGVRSAMPVAQALRLCPDVVVLEPHFDKYARYSARVVGILGDVTPLVEQVSIDEAFLDVAGAVRLLGSPASIGASIRRRVLAETGLTCSVGVAGTKFMAKLASTRAKPDGMLVIPVAETLTFLYPLPIGALWGVGPATQETLHRYGLRTVGDVASTPLDVLRRWVGDASGVRLHELANGVDPRGVEPVSREKSIGHEQTFEYDVTDASVLRRELLRLSGQVAARLRAHRLTSRTVALKLRYADFRTISRSRTLPEPTNVGRRLYEEAASLLDAVLQSGDAIRLLGVRAEQLLPDGSSAPVLWDPDEDWRDAENAIDRVAARFGAGAVTSAALVGNGPRRVGDTGNAKVLREREQPG